MIMVNEVEQQRGDRQSHHQQGGDRQTLYLAQQGVFFIFLFPFIVFTGDCGLL